MSLNPMRDLLLAAASRAATYLWVIFRALYLSASACAGAALSGARALPNTERLPASLLCQDRGAPAADPCPGRCADREGRGIRPEPRDPLGLAAWRRAMSALAELRRGDPHRDIGGPRLGRWLGNVVSTGQRQGQTQGPLLRRPGSTPQARSHLFRGAPIPDRGALGPLPPRQDPQGIHLAPCQAATITSNPSRRDPHGHARGAPRAHDQGRGVPDRRRERSSAGRSPCSRRRPR